jgi:hypothetical protein
VSPADDSEDDEPSVSTLHAGLQAVQAVTRSLRNAGLLGDRGELEVLLPPGLP